ncbi:MAG: glycogen debranching protein GlgX, partial [Methylococcales bacterium]|nr:glycogen debranching protein GlgX [Methylococcales bacterium]
RIFPGGANFNVYARNATGVDLLLFDDVEAKTPTRVITLDPALNRTFYYWHVFVPDIQPGQLYGYRVHGSADKGFDPGKVLLDPYSRGVAIAAGYQRAQAAAPALVEHADLKSVLVDLRGYDWQGDMPLRRSFEETVIYELHVGGFTRHPSSGVSPERRGTYAGVIEKIPYLKALGVTAVELLPVFQFDEQDAPSGKRNYWGYSPMSFFAPHAQYSSDPTPLGAIYEFRDMIKALHRAGIEVILDVVFNHTAEGDHTGPVFCYKGLANEDYYITSPDGLHANYSGTGNTLKANNPIVRRMILDSLRYWVTEMHVDGFRFDLASIFSRDDSGQPIPNPPILWDIETDPVLAGSKLIAEAWDAAGLYQLGNFIGNFWNEWNGQFRDDIRRYVKSDSGSLATLPSRLLGSPDVFHSEHREAVQSINFVTCHDGFTLNDLVCYNDKHNQANGEDNRDGNDYNLSWNCGVEGPTDDPDIEWLRVRQIRNLLTLNLLAIGVPMLSMGDEIRRSQQGNNNAYCQNNELSWLDWRLLDQHRDVYDFTRNLIGLRGYFYCDGGLDTVSLNQFIQQLYLRYFAPDLTEPDWSQDSHSLGMMQSNGAGTKVFYWLLNSYWEAVTFQLPQEIEGHPVQWREVVDTGSKQQPALAPEQALIVRGRELNVASRALRILLADTPHLASATDT